MEAVLLLSSWQTCVIMSVCLILGYKESLIGASNFFSTGARRHGLLVILIDSYLILNVVSQYCVY